MKEINIKVTEALLATYGITAEELADTAGYQVQVVNDDYVEAIGTPTIPNPDYIPPVYQTDAEGNLVYAEGDEIMMDPLIETPAVGEPELPNPDYVPPVGERFLPNPEKRTEFLAKKILEGGVTVLIKKALDAKRREAERALRAIDQEEKMIVEDIVTRAEIVTVE